MLICAGLGTCCCCWSCANLLRLSVESAVDLWNFVEASSLGQIAEEVYGAGAPDGAEREDMLGNPSVRSHLFSSKIPPFLLEKESSGSS